MRYIITLFYLFMFLSCKKSVLSWEVYRQDQTKLSDKYETFEALKIIQDKAYLIGAYNPTGNLMNQKAIVYKSDFENKHWDLVSSNIGVFNNAEITNTSMYLIKTSFNNKNSFAGITTQLCKLNLLNNEFEIIKGIKGVPKSISFKNNGFGYLFVSNPYKSKMNHILTTKNDGVLWDSIVVNKVIKKDIYFKQKAYLLENRYSNEYKKRVNDKFYILDLESKKLKEVDLKSNIIDFIVIEEDEIYMLSKNNGVTSVNRLENGLLKKVYEFDIDEDLLPKSIYKHNNFVSVLMKELKGFGTSYHLHLSFDNGKSFKKEKLPITNYVMPISYYKDEKIIIYSGAGRVSVGAIDNGGKVLD